MRAASSENKQSSPPEGLDPSGSWPQRFDPNHVGSRFLAPYIWPLMLNPRGDWVYLRGLQDRLLDLTVRMAREHTNWYADTLPQSIAPIDSTALEDFPTISRQHLIEHREHLIAKITTFGFASFTSGSTTQPPLMIERAIEEQRYLSNMTASILEHALATRPAPLGLVATNGSHGEVFQVPGRGYAFPVNFEQDAGFRKAEWLLLQNFNLRGFERQISFIQGFFDFIHLLVLYLQQRDVHLEPNLIKRITCYGMGIPSSRRAAVAKYFSAEVDDNYSLAEVHGCARYDPVDDAYVYSPMAFAEVVELASGRRVENGSGELVLTTLFPFTQRFPLIRYRTGDIVFTPGRVALGPLFRIRGRRIESVPLPGGLLVCKEEVAFALEEEESVARAATGGIAMIKSSESINGPSFVLNSSETGGVYLRIELAYKDLGEEVTRAALIERLRLRVLDVVPADVRQMLEQRPTLLNIELIPLGCLVN